MDAAQAWHEVFSLAYGNKWVKIPPKLINLLGLPSGIGIAGGILCTKNTANYVNQFINRVNTIGENQK